MRANLPSLIENYFYPECCARCDLPVRAESLVLHDLEQIDEICDSMVVEIKECVLVQEYEKLFNQKLLKCSVSLLLNPSEVCLFS